MDRFDILKLRDLPIEGVAERLGLRVQKHKALCPFHDDSHPSLTFNVSKNTYRCYVCEAHGGVIDLVMNHLQKTFVEACEWLANENNIILMEWKPIHKPSSELCSRVACGTTINPQPSLDVEYLTDLVCQPVLNAEAQDFLFAQRHYNKAVVRWLGISSISYPTPCWRYGRPYYDAPSLLIPYRDVDGNLLSVQSRYLGSSKDAPRFRFPRGSKCHIFNLPILKMIKAGEPLYVSEGVTDCIALLSAGHKAIAIPSATLLNKEDMQLLNSLGVLDLHIYPDQDIAGEKLYIQLLHIANQIGACVTRHRLPEGCKDFSDYWVNQFEPLKPLNS